MNSSTLQFAVAGALIAAWAWMLGRPILTNLFRRSRRDSVGHFRYQQAVLGRPLDQEPTSRPSRMRAVAKPLLDWWRQPIERRRLQIMLGFSFATFSALLLAIALRGAAVRLFLIMVCFFVVYLGYAALVGAAQLRKDQRAFAAEAASTNITTRTSTGTTTTAGRGVSLRPLEAAEPAERPQERSSAELVDALLAEPPVEVHEPDVHHVTEVEQEPALGIEEEDGSVWPEEQHLDHGLLDDGLLDEEYRVESEPSVFGTGVFEDDFFEPIPELQFAPLNLDASLIQPEEEVGAALEAAGWDESVSEDALWDESVSEDVSWDEPVSPMEAEAPPAELAEPVGVDEDARPEPSFTTPPAQRTRPTRQKARPIYIESQLDEQDEEQRVVND